LATTLYFGGRLADMSIGDFGGGPQPFDVVPQEAVAGRYACDVTPVPYPLEFQPVDSYNDNVYQ
jgi:hypothetical protein